MSKFNKAVNNKIENYEGAEAYSQSKELEFISILLTSFVKDQFYRSESESTSTLKNLIQEIKDKKFLAKSAIYARNEFGMRSITHIVAGELAKIVKGEKWTKRFYEKVVRRVDDITEILSYYLDQYKKPIPNSLKKGLSLAFSKFNEYQLAKYRSTGKELSLVDVVNLTHPKPSEKNRIALRKLVGGELKSTGTWESMLTEAGKNAANEENKQELKKETWKELILEKKIGYFALLRNLRNIIDQAPEIVNDACELLISENLIKKSLVLPFRFSTAIQEIEKITGDNSRKVLRAINRALEISCNNVPKFKGSTLVIADHSASMSWKDSKYGTPLQIACLFTAIMIKANMSDCMIFGDIAKYIGLNPDDSLLTLTNILLMANTDNRYTHVGHGTNFNAIFEVAERAYDRIIIFSDMQGWVRNHFGESLPTGSFSRYRQKHQCYPHIYSVDLQGYGSMMFPERNVYCLAGFSEKIFDIMKFLETDKKALFSEINKIEL
jgi:hypothetical protein